MHTRELWQAVLAEMELKLSKANFTTWFGESFIAEYENGDVVIAASNTMSTDWLERKYHKDIIRAIEDITNQPVRSLTYRVEKMTDSLPTIPISEPQRSTSTTPSTELGFTVTETTPLPQSNIVVNPTQTFSSYVIGKQNELAFAAAQAVAQHPGGTYNPLFIYGGVGLGKTHLLHAIANSIRAKWQNARITYVTCEHFTNDYVNAVRSGKVKEFREKYRNTDLLLMDDIQFITGKEGTQEEFFHTFNALHQDNKQLVITSDRSPKSIAGLEKRLQSRLEWGMLVDIGVPDLETRYAILERKCLEKGANLDRESMRFISSAVTSSIRELEGVLNKILAIHEFRGLTPTLETIKPIVASFEGENTKKTVTSRQIISVVSEYFDITSEEILGKSREKRLAFPLQIIMYLLRKEAGSSYPTIGAELGGRDHTTAMHAHNKIQELVESGEEKLTKDIELIRQRLYVGI